MTEDLQTEDTIIDLPALVFGPVARPIGYILHVIDAASSLKVLSTEEVKISPRKKSIAYALENGQKILITTTKKLARPAEIDGVIFKDQHGNMK